MEQDTPRKHRLIRDTLNAVAHDRAGLENALYKRRYYTIPLTGLSLHSVGAAFRSAVNLLSPPARNEDFRPDEIATHPAFAALRDKMNEQGLDIGSWRGHYALTVTNLSHVRGQRIPSLTFRVVPWDGVKKPLEAYDTWKHGPGGKGPYPGL